MKEFFKLSQPELALIAVLIVTLAATLGYFLGTQHNFQTKAITKEYS